MSDTNYPLVLEGRLGEPLSRWMWTVKWVLAVPHFLLLSVLWFLFGIVTIVAGAFILFTGRYPRGLFDFNVGVLRWTWRVAFYAFTLGTDQYPPFGLQTDADYPASLSVDYPEHLSQRLVLVKWWLLAVPHYVVISVFGGGTTPWTWNFGEDETHAVFGGGLIGLLALIAGVFLLVKKEYPKSIFDFVMGMERWTYRVVAYAALMRDEYPPFRLDTGGSESHAATSPPSTPGHSTELVVS